MSVEQGQTGQGILLWFAEVDSVREAIDVQGLLDRVARAERDRAQRFHREADRLQFLIGRNMLRGVLAGLSGMSPQAIRLDFNPWGRPEWADGRVGFSISHCPGCVVLAVIAETLDIGVDVEPYNRAAQIVEVADRVFSKAELEYLSGAPDTAYVRAWTLKEAYVKARGRGLSMPLRDISLVTGVEPVALHCPARIDTRAADWLFENVPTVTGFQVSLACKPPHASRPTLAVYPWSP